MTTFTTLMEGLGTPQEGSRPLHEVLKFFWHEADIFCSKDIVVAVDYQWMNCRGDFGNSALASYLKQIWQFSLMK